MNKFEFVVHSANTQWWEGFKSYKDAFRKFKSRMALGNRVAMWRREAHGWTRLYAADNYPDVSAPYV